MRSRSGFDEDPPQRCYDSDSGFEASGVGAGTDIRLNRFRNVAALILQPDTAFAAASSAFEFAYNTVTGGRFGSNIGGSPALTLRRNIHTTSLNHTAKRIEDNPMTEAELDLARDYRPLPGTDAWASGVIAYDAQVPGGRGQACPEGASQPASIPLHKTATRRTVRSV